MKRRVFALVLGILVAGLLAGPRPATGDTADAGLVLAALNVLEQRYAKPVQPVALLNAAIESLGQAGNVDLTAIPDGTLEAQAQGAFRQDFAKAVQTGAAKEEDLAYQATRAMLASLHDSHTLYIDPAHWAARQVQVGGKPGFVGIGFISVSIKDDAGQSVLYAAVVFPGAPAAAAGLQVLDQFTGGAPAAGPAGSTVTFTVQRKGQPVTLTATRQAIQTPIVVAVPMVRPGIAYINFLGFAQGANDAVRTALKTAQAQGPLRGVILDLRQNGGGQIDELEGIAGALLPPRTLLAHTVSRQQGSSEFLATGAPLLPQTPLVVLTSGRSESAAEILSLALHDAHRATLIGEKTAGAYQNNNVVPLPAGGMSVTVREISGPQYEQVEGIGITPDQVIPLTVDDVLNGTDSQLDAPLKALGAGN